MPTQNLPSCQFTLRIVVTQRHRINYRSTNPNLPSNLATPNQQATHPHRTPTSPSTQPDHRPTRRGRFQTCPTNQTTTNLIPRPTHPTTNTQSKPIIKIIKITVQTTPQPKQPTHTSPQQHPRPLRSSPLPRTFLPPLPGGGPGAAKGLPTHHRNTLNNQHPITAHHMNQRNQRFRLDSTATSVVQIKTSAQNRHPSDKAPRDIAASNRVGATTFFDAATTNL